MNKFLSTVAVAALLALGASSAIASPIDGSFTGTTFPGNDDGSVFPVPLGFSFNFFGNNALPCFAPGDAIPRRCFVPQALGKVEHAHRHQQGGRDKYQPGPSCEY